MNGYIRKITSIALTLLFCIAVIIGAGVMLSIRNVNVEYIYYSERGDGEYEQTVDNFEGLRGKNLLFLSDGEIAACVSGDILTLESYDKVYPCTLNIVVKERLEQYCRANSSGGYDVYDSQGRPMGSRSENINPADDSPNVLLVADDDELALVLQMCGYFADNFGSIRNLVESVTTGYDAILSNSSLTFRLYSGLQIVIYDYEEYSAQKISAVYNEYCTLSESEKLRGAICAVTLSAGTSGEYAAYYTDNWGD
ncbi:MAG TPA: hypothetical protein IAC67_00100 [Candidatus Coproplasma excrementipullorum]|nr:hypothetical protein [Candidatus Coproplasma excrementipullorum]